MQTVDAGSKPTYHEKMRVTPLGGGGLDPLENHKWL